MKFITLEIWRFLVSKIRKLKNNVKSDSSVFAETHQWYC